MADLTGRWQDLGVSMGIRPGDLEAIISASAHSPSDCLRKVLTLWLRQNYKVRTSFIPGLLLAYSEATVGFCDYIVEVKVGTSFNFNPLSIRERGSVLYLGMAMEISILPY